MLKNNLYLLTFSFLTAALLFTFIPRAGAEPPPYTIDLNDSLMVPAPDGSHIQCYFFMPREKQRPLPVVILVPPGGQAASTLFPYANYFATNGMATFAFDPQGRGKSDGAEDYNGVNNQDALGAIVKYLRSLTGEVDKRNIGLLSFYDGMTMCVGMLWRNTKLDVKYLIDLEGPGARQDCMTMRCPAPQGVGLDDFFWKDREAMTHGDRLTCRYLRLQAKTDHAMNEDKTYAINLYNRIRSGKFLPWIRCNYNGTYQELDPKFPGKYQWLRKVDNDVLFRFVNEMAEMPPLPESVK